jgi:protoheme IX farnesyltransferase
MESTAVAAIDRTPQRATLRTIYRDYSNLVKPGITMSNVMTAFTGVWVAARGAPSLSVTLATLAGSAFVVMSGCALNNVIDRDIDQRMARTASRPLPNGRIKPAAAIAVGAVAGAVGVALLDLFATPLSALMALIGLFFYVVVYTRLFKRTTTLGTLIGGISGAMPPLIGWTAVTGSLSSAAWVLFAILFVWQVPHFLSLGMRRVEDYRGAGIPLLPVVYGFAATKRQIILWTLALLPVSILLFALGAVSWLYLVPALILGGVYIWKALRGLRAKDDLKWATDMFGYSLIYLTVMCVAMVIGARF